MTGFAYKADVRKRDPRTKPNGSFWPKADIHPIFSRKFRNAHSVFSRRLVRLAFLAPDVFGVLESLKLMLMIVVGGLGSILGAIFGAILISLLPVALSFLKDVLPAGIGQQAGLEPMLFGLIIVIFIVFEPEGINGRWKKLLHFFETFPYYRKSSFVRQKSYLKTERMR